MTDLPRLLILGNSHVSAPRLAYISAPEDWPDWDIDFLGMPGGNLVKLALKDGVLLPETPEISDHMKFYNLVRRLDIRGYDAFALVGGFGWRDLATICADHRSVDFPSVIQGDRDCQLVSRQFLHDVLCTRIRGSDMGRMLERLRTLDKPVVVVPEPLPSTECVADPARFGIYQAMAQRGDGAHWKDRFVAAANEAIGAVARITFWPAEAIEQGAFTRSDLMRGALRLRPDAEVQIPENDFAHGNLDYGRMVMDQIAAALLPAQVS